MTNPRRQNGHRRNQLIQTIKRRDTHCWLPTCQQPINPNLPPGQPNSPEVHELIPISKGGNPLDPTNCVLTHRKCNRWIGTSTPEEVQHRINNQQTPPTHTTTTLTW